MDSPKPGRFALLFIVVVVLIDSIGFGIVIPVFPGLIVELTGRSTDEAARLGGWLAFAYAIMQFGCGPLMGNLSDRFGRRPILIACLTAFAIDYAIMGFAGSLWLLFVGRIIAGLTGATYTTAYAYVADISPPKQRAANFGKLSVAFGLGFIIGPGLGGLVADFGLRVPFFIAAGLAGVSALIGMFILPESLPAESRRTFDLARANPVGAFASIRRLDPAVLSMAIALFVWQVGHQSLQSTWAFYAIYRFDWSTAMIGLSLAAVGVTSAVVGGWLIGPIVARIGERRAVLVAMTSGFAAFLIYGLGTAGWAIYLGILIGSLSAVGYPAMNALMSANVAADAQGELQGALASLGSLATIIGPPLMTQLFASFSGPNAIAELPGAPFLLAAVLTLLSLWLFLRGGAKAVVSAPA